MHLSETKISRIKKFIAEHKKFAFDIIEKKKKMFPGIYGYVKWLLLILKYCDRVGFKQESKLKLIQIDEDFLENSKVSLYQTQVEKKNSYN